MESFIQYKIWDEFLGCAPEVGLYIKCVSNPSKKKLYE